MDGQIVDCCYRSLYYVSKKCDFRRVVVPPVARVGTQSATFAMVQPRPYPIPIADAAILLARPDLLIKAKQDKARRGD